MPAELITLTVITAALIVAAAVVYLLPYLVDPGGTPEDGVPVGEIMQRVTEIDRQCHRAPLDPYSVDEAHLIMQARINCDVDSCGAKHAAWSTLVDAGRITPTEQVVR